MLLYDENTMKPFATIKDTAAMTGFSQSFLRRLVKNRTIPFVRVGKGATATYMVNVRGFIQRMSEDSLINGDPEKEADYEPANGS